MFRNVVRLDAMRIHYHRPIEQNEDRFNCI
jgi:hypothetical protein